MTIDEEIEISGITYWLRAEVARTTTPVAVSGSYWGSPFLDTEYVTGPPRIDELALYAWSAPDQGYEVLVSDPRALAAASAWAVEHG